MNQAAAVIGPDSTAEDTGAEIVEFDAAVGMLDVDNTGVEAVEPTAKKKQSSDPEDIFSLEQNGAQDQFPASTRYFKTC